MDKIFNLNNQKFTRKDLRKSMPKGEKLLWCKLKGNKLGYRFRRQYGIDNYVVDFCCPKLRFAVEIDGKTHDFPDQIIYDKKRQEYIESLGIKVKRFYSEDIFEDIDCVVEQIKCLCEKLDKERLSPSY